MQAEHVTYSEPGVMQEDGFLGGIFADVTVVKYKGWNCSLSGSYVAGSTVYDSDEVNTGIDIRSSNPGSIVDLRLEAACDMNSLPVVEHLFTGAGYRRLDDDVRGPAGYVGYRRVQHYLYIPAGLTATLLSHDNWQLTGTIEYDFFARGRNETLGAELSQDSGYGCRASLLFNRQVTFAIIDSFQVEPFMQYWNIGMSSLERNTYEPDNHSTIIGIRVSALF